MDSIRETLERIKGLGPSSEGWLMPAVVVCVGITSFGLGRLSALEERRPAVSLYQASETESVAFAPGGEYVASRTGSVYYYPWCGGARSIAEKSKVWFSNEGAAQRAGYRAAKNCAGLSQE